MIEFPSMKDVPEVLKNLTGDSRNVIELPDGKVFVKHWIEKTPEETEALETGKRIRFGDYEKLVPKEIGELEAERIQ